MSLLPPQGADAPSDPHSQMMGQLSQGHDQARAQYDKLAEADKTIKAVRAQVDTLVNLGDKVRTEDLVKAASRCVAAGSDPTAIASLLSSAPEGGQALATWAEQQDENLQKTEAMLDTELSKAKFSLGLSALHVVAGSAIGQRRDAAQAMMPQNDLAGAGAGSGPSQSPQPAGEDMGAPASSPAESTPDAQNALMMMGGSSDV